MEQIYITALNIHGVRHLKEVEILLSNEERKNLILTGKNGSGKTSVLDALSNFLEYIVSTDYVPQNELQERLARWEKKITRKKAKQGRMTPTVARKQNN